MASERGERDELPRDPKLSSDLNGREPHEILQPPILDRGNTNIDESTNKQEYDPDYLNATKDSSENMSQKSNENEVLAQVEPTKAVPLWCSQKGRNHGALYEWDIPKCPACGENLGPPKDVSAQEDCKQPESRQSRRSSNASDSTYRSDGGNEKSRIKPQPNPYGMDPYVPIDKVLEGVVIKPIVTPDVNYRVRFLYEGGIEIGSRPYHELLDLEKERKFIVNSSDPILEIVTTVQTNIRRDSAAEQSHFGGYRSASAELMAEGILRNSRYSVETISNNIKIRSQRVIQIFKKVLTYYPGLCLTGDNVILKEPYCFAFHNMEAIDSYQQVTAHTDEETRRHLTVLRNAVERDYKVAVEQEQARYLKSTPMVTFKMLWLLYKPGTTVYTQMDRGLQACVIKSVEFDQHSVSKLATSYSLELWYLNFDGRRMGRCACERIIAPFEGERQMLSLSVYPAQYRDEFDQGATRKHLEDRGERFFKYLRGAQVQYRGESVGPTPRWYEGRAIIDITSYYNYGTSQGYNNNVIFGRPEIGDIQDSANVEDEDSDDERLRIYSRSHLPRPSVPKVYRNNSSRRPPLGPGAYPVYEPAQNLDEEEDSTKTYDARFPWREYDDINPKDKLSLDLVDLTSGRTSRHRYLLCPKRIIGFLLKSRNWEQLDIECCFEPKNNREAVDTLVMPEERKTMIKALVYRYTDRETEESKGSAPWAADFIENKGDGQIFLLHGSPGVGKTYTAECIAESTGRPLLSLTCGDIGNDEQALESRLSKWFRLAEIWGAVMLLDEADVFLERRATSDLHRNSLVTVFLRTMEYYRGILFLTTNRVGHFDDAFISRIHVVLRYDSFTVAEREKIWEQFFAKLEKERSEYIIIPRATKKYVLKDPEMTSIAWNGREIRNSFQTAVALAEYRFLGQKDREDGDKACLERQDFEKVCEMTSTFKKYLHSVSGHDESQRARLEMARNDDFSEP